MKPTTKMPMAYLHRLRDLQQKQEKHGGVQQKQNSPVSQMKFWNQLHWYCLRDLEWLLWRRNEWNLKKKLYKINEVNKILLIYLSEPAIEAKPKSDWENPHGVEQENARGYKHLNQTVTGDLVVKMVMIVVIVVIMLMMVMMEKVFMWQAESMPGRAEEHTRQCWLWYIWWWWW